MKQGVNCQIRWIIRRDMAAILQIEQASFEFCWTEEDFLHCLRQRNCIGVVAEYNGCIVGFMVYELYKSRLHLINFAVHPAYRRKSVGAQMIERLVNRLRKQRRSAITLEVRETNLDAQYFFVAEGFRALGVLRNHYEDSCEDAYAMVYNLEVERFPESITQRMQGMFKEA